MNLLAKAQYDEARAAFRAFAEAHPKDDLTPQAVYWVGDIAYVQKDYPGAAQAFAEEIKKFRRVPRAPESMLRLGQSLLAINQKTEGCTALAALPEKLPHRLENHPSASHRRPQSGRLPLNRSVREAGEQGGEQSRLSATRQPKKTAAPGSSSRMSLNSFAAAMTEVARAAHHGRVWSQCRAAAIRSR